MRERSVAPQSRSIQERPDRPSGSSSSPILQAGQEPRFIRIDELGDLLRVSRSTAYAMVASGLIPSVRLSPRVLRVDRNELELWLANRVGR
jgi:excisionase family DNA binding protein